jgi:hypothetical protein
MDLQKYCSKDAENYGMDKPFTQGDMTWATNGWVAIGVPAISGVSENDISPIMDKLSKPGGEETWFDLPEISVDTCEVCQGKVGGIECYECKGHGHVALKHDYGKGYTMYEGIVCGSCEGEGTVSICPFCSETGVDTTKGMLIIGQAKFKQNALWMIKDLPGIQIAPTGPTTFAYLKFDGGRGYLMPGVSSK